MSASLPRPSRETDALLVVVAAVLLASVATIAYAYGRAALAIGELSFALSAPARAAVATGPLAANVLVHGLSYAAALGSAFGLLTVGLVVPASVLAGKGVRDVMRLLKPGAFALWLAGVLVVVGSAISPPA